MCYLDRTFLMLLTSMATRLAGSAGRRYATERSAAHRAIGPDPHAPSGPDLQHRAVRGRGTAARARHGLARARSAQGDAAHDADHGRGHARARRVVPSRRRARRHDDRGGAARARGGAGRGRLRAGAARVPVPGAVRAQGGAAHPRRRDARAAADRVRALPDESGRRESREHHHDLGGAHGRDRLLAAGDARQPVGRHRAAARQHLPARRLDQDPGRHRADRQHSLALSGGGHQQRRDGDHPERATDEESGHGPRAPRRCADPVAAAGRFRRRLRCRAVEGDRGRGSGARAGRDPVRRGRTRRRLHVHRVRRRNPSRTASSTGSPTSCRIFRRTRRSAPTCSPTLARHDMEMPLPRRVLLTQRTVDAKRAVGGATRARRRASTSCPTCRCSRR